MNAFGARGPTRVAAMAGLVSALTFAKIVSAEPVATMSVSSAEPAMDPASAPPSGDLVAPSGDSSARPWLAPATKIASAPRIEEHESGSFRGLLLPLLILAGLGAAAYWLRADRVRSRAEVQGRLRLLSSVRVGPKSYVALVGIGDRAVLVGATDSSVRRLAWIDPPQGESGEVPAAAPAAVPEGERPTFATLIGKLLSVGAAQKADAGAEAAATSPAQGEAGGEPRIVPSGNSTASALRVGGRDDWGDSTRAQRRPREASVALTAAAESKDVVDLSPRARRDTVESLEVEAPVRANVADRGDIEEQAKGLARRGRRRT